MLAWNFFKSCGAVIAMHRKIKVCIWKLIPSSQDNHGRILVLKSFFFEIESFHICSGGFIQWVVCYPNHKYALYLYLHLCMSFPKTELSLFIVEQFQRSYLNCFWHCSNPSFAPLPILIITSGFSLQRVLCFPTRPTTLLHITFAPREYTCDIYLYENMLMIFKETFFGAVISFISIDLQWYRG